MFLAVAATLVLQTAFAPIKPGYYLDLVLTPTDETLHLRRAVMRPEQPAARFQLSDYIDWTDDDWFGFFLSSVAPALKKDGYEGSVDFDAPMWDGVWDDVEDIEDELLDEANTVRTVDPNVGIASGGWTERRWRAKKHKATIVLMKEDGGLPVRVPGVSIPVGDYWRAEDRPYFEKFYPDTKPDRALQQAIGGFTYQAKPESAGVQFTFPTPGKDPFGTDESVYFQEFNAWWDFSLGQNPPGKANQLLSESGLNFKDFTTLSQTLAPQGDDMNYLNFTLTENDCHGSIDAPAGTLWLPSKPGYQRMMTGVRFDHMVAFDQVESNVGPRPPQQVLKMRTLCLDMKLKMPEAGVRYYPCRPKDQALYTLGELMDSSSFRGPWDQARTWIYMDKASLAEVNDTLQMRLPASAYLAALGDLARNGLVSTADAKLAKIFDPALLSAAGATTDVTQWFATNLERNHRVALVKFLKAAPSDYLKLGSEATDKAAIDTFAAQMKIFLASRHADVRLATLDLLVNNASRLAAMKGKVGKFTASQIKGDAAEVGLAKKAAESF